MWLPTFDLVIQSDNSLRDTFSFGSIQDPPGDGEPHDMEHGLEDEEEEEGSHVPERQSLPYSRTLLPCTAAPSGAPQASQTPSQLPQCPQVVLLPHHCTLPRALCSSTLNTYIFVKSLNKKDLQAYSPS